MRTGGDKEKSFASPFPLHNVGLQYDPAKLQEVILKSGYFTVQEKHIDNYDEIDSDFIFDCRGKPSNWDDYEELTNPLNAVLLGEGESKDCNVNWTRAVATPDGWTFVIPNTTQTTSYGYLYNDEITSTEEASANFEKIFSLANQGIYLNEEVDNLKFKNYVAKKPIIDDRIILGGNRLFFLEPLESTAVEAYSFWLRKTFDWIIHKATTPASISQEIITYTHQIQNYIMWHYMYGSKYDTPFWESTKNLVINDPVFIDFLTYAKQHSMTDLLDTTSSTFNDRYGQWGLWNFKHWNDGMME